jgi:hypothetical protein
MNEVIDWFSGPGNAAFAAFLLSVAACVASAITWFKSRETQRRLAQIAESRERDRLTDKRKARLVAAVIKGDSPKKGFWDPKNYELVIQNTGNCAASNIRVVIDGAPVLKCGMVLPGQDEISVVGGLSQAAYRLCTWDGCPRSLGTVITWTDDSGEPGQYRTTLTF